MSMILTCRHCGNRQLNLNGEDLKSAICALIDRNEQLESLVRAKVPRHFKSHGNIPLTPKMRQILGVLLAASPRIVKLGYILEVTYPDGEGPQEVAIQHYIIRLRRRLPHGGMIICETGVGYYMPLAAKRELEILFGLEKRGAPFPAPQSLRVGGTTAHECQSDAVDSSLTRSETA
jgi:hypothetical protein